MENIIQEIMISNDEIQKRIQELGHEITRDYEGKNIVMICTLKGAVLFFTDLCRSIKVPMSMDFISVSSYLNRMESSGVVKINKDLDENIEGQDVIVVEDIVDSGRTLHYLIENLKLRNPNTIKICSLLDKPYHRVKDIKIDYVGFEIEDEFVVGYGLDYMQLYRNLPYVGVLKRKYYID